MAVLVDSNILVYIANPQSPLYQQVRDAIDLLFQRGETLCIIPQNLVEFWAVATRPIQNNGLGLTPAQAQAELARAKSFFRLLDDDSKIFLEWERLVIQHSVVGKNAHDARIAAAMNVHQVTTLLTVNKADFKRFQNITAMEPKEVI